MKSRLLIALFLSLGTLGLAQQDRLLQIENALQPLVIEQPGLDETVSTSVSGVTLTEYIRALGINHSLNINVSEDLTDKLINNFSNAKVSDVLVFLCKEYQLDIEVIGGIISVTRYVPEIKPITFVPKIPLVYYNDTTDFLSLDLKVDSLDKVAREITKLSGRNVIIAPELAAKQVSVFIQNRPFADALDKMAFANGLTVEKDGNFFLLAEQVEETTAQAQRQKTETQSTPDPDSITCDKLDNGRLTISSQNAPIVDIIDFVAKVSGHHFFILTPPEGERTLFIENATFDEFLTYVFHGSDTSFDIQEDVYLIGNVKNDGIRTTELVQLNYRTIENVFGGSGGAQGGNFNNNNNVNGNQNQNRNRNNRFANDAGSFLSPDLEIKPFPELNAFIVSGSYPDVKLFKDYIHQIDQVVPVVMIEVIILDVNKNLLIQTGLNAGVGEGVTPDQTNGTITGPTGNPGVNLDLSQETLNSILGSFSGLGLANIGPVSNDFYVSIKALESNGVVKTRSTPQLSTLNSYTANLSIGRQEYYLETTTSINPSAAANIVTEQQIWQPLNADLSLDITPVVSGAGQVTLTITVNQSDFTERAGPNGPFGSVEREFSSSIRVKNGEMVLLGGLEDKTVNKTGSGIPFLARIPVIKWFFGNQERNKSESQLHIFIKPTIIY